MLKYCSFFILMSALALPAALTSAQPGNVQSARPECEYVAVHAMMGSDQYTCDHGVLVHQSQSADMKGGFRKRTETFRPSPAAWSNFWKSMDTAGVWKWQRHYGANINIEDGEGWLIELHHEHSMVKSQGYNASPRSFAVFVHALERLMDDARKNPEPEKPGDRTRAAAETR